MTLTTHFLLIAGLVLEALILGGVFWTYRRAIRRMNNRDTTEGRSLDE